ncbi:MAG TPA: hypothetical protein P5137_05575 [Candidatus Brocadiia bacterium]|nr:hypothetical protein [Candidatus Brocadiia bacterium]
MNIGWASRDVTPPRPVSLYGQFHVRISTRVNDPLTVTALAVEGPDGRGGQDHAVLVSLDHVGISEKFLDSVRQALGDQAPGLDPQKIILNCTHTHIGPDIAGDFYPPQGPEVMAPAECAQLLRTGIVQSISEAWRNRAPGAVTWAFGQAVVGHNRRAVYADGSAKMYGKTDTPDFDSIEGYEDHSLNALFTWNTSRQLTGVILNLACPSQVTEGADYVSADFWHETREEIRSRCGKDLFILPQCAPAGDQSPHFLIHKKEEAYMRERLGLTERQIIGRKIADAVDDLLPTAAAAAQSDCVVRHHVETLNLDVRRVTDEELACAKNEIAKLEASTPQNDREASRKFTRIKWYGRAVQRYQTQKTQPCLPIELHVLRLGQVAFATNPFELFLDYGIRIKARSAALQNFLIQLSCGSGGYLPTAKAVRMKSYGAEPASNAVGPEGGQTLVDRTVAIIQNMWQPS